MALSSKTISEFQQEYTSVGYGKVEAELNHILDLLNSIQEAQLTVANAVVSHGRQSEEAVAAKEELKTLKEVVAFRRDRLKTAQDIDRAEGDLTAAHVARQELKSKADVQYEKDFQKLVQEEAAQQAQRDKAMESSAKAEAARVQEGVRRAKEAEAAKRAIYDYNAKFYIELEAGTAKVDLTKPELAAERKRAETIQKDLFNQKLRSLNSPDALQENAPEALLQLVAFRTKIADSMQAVAGKLSEKGLSPERINALSKQYSILGSQIKEVDRAVQGATRASELWNKQHTAMGWIVNFWEKLKTVFWRVFDALVSFTVINTAVNLVGAFTKSIISSNAELEVLDARLSLMVKDGGSFDRLKSKIVELTLNTPFIIKDFIDASVSLRAFGLNAEKYLSPIADWATAIGKDIQDVALAFSKITTGSPRTALLLTTRGISKADFDREFAQTHDRALALANIIEKRFGGMAERVSQTFTGMLSNVQDAWFLLSAALGKDIFASISKDITLVFSSIKSWAKEPPAAIRVLSAAIDGLYQSLKLLADAAIVLIGIRIFEWLNSVTVFMQTLRFAFAAGSTAIIPLGTSLRVAGLLFKDNIVGGAIKAGNAIANFATSVYGASIAIGAIVYAYQELAAVQARVVEGEKSIREALAGGGRASEGYVFAIEKQIKVLEDATSTWEQIKTLSFIFPSDSEYMDEQREKLKLFRQEYEISKSLTAEENNRRNALAEQITLMDTLNLKKAFADKVGGDVIRKTYMDVAKGILAKRPLFIETGAGKSSEEEAQRVFAGFQARAKKIGIELSKPVFLGLGGRKLPNGLDPQQLNDVLFGLESIKETLKDESVLKAGALGQGLASIPGVMESIIANGGPLEKILDGIKSSFVDSGKDGKKSLKDYGDELASITAELEAFRLGDDAIFARIKANRARLDGDVSHKGLLEQLQKAKDGPNKIRLEIDVKKTQLELEKDNRTVQDKTRTYEEKIAELKVRNLEATKGESALFIELATEQQNLLNLQSARLGLAGSIFGMQKNEVDTAESQAKIQALLARIDEKRLSHQEKMSELAIRELEVVGSIAEKRLGLQKAQEELDFAINPDAKKLRESRLFDIADPVSGAEKQIRSKEELRTRLETEANLNDYLASVAKSEFERNSLLELSQMKRTESEKENADIIDLQTKIVNIRKQMLSDPSINFGEGVAKAIRSIRGEIEGFWDEMGSLTVSSFKEVATFFIENALFGNDQKDKLTSQITDARTQLGLLQEERQRDFNQVLQRKRLETESNDQYLERIQRVDELQAREADVYTYKTKELELLDQINKLEQERNNIITERLKSLAGKVFDKILNFGLNLALSSLFKTGGDNSYGSGDWSTQSGRPSLGGGNVESAAQMAPAREKIIQQIQNQPAIQNRNVYNSILNNNRALTTSITNAPVTNRIYSLSNTFDNARALTTSITNAPITNRMQSLSNTFNNQRQVVQPSKPNNVTNNFSLSINGDVYGEKDFRMKVDQAFRELSAQRSR